MTVPLLTYPEDRVAIPYVLAFLHTPRGDVLVNARGQREARASAIFLVDRRKENYREIVPLKYLFEEACLRYASKHRRRAANDFRRRSA